MDYLMNIDETKQKRTESKHKNSLITIIIFVSFLVYFIGLEIYEVYNLTKESFSFSKVFINECKDLKEYFGNKITISFFILVYEETKGLEADMHYLFFIKSLNKGGKMDIYLKKRTGVWSISGATFNDKKNGSIVIKNCNENALLQNNQNIGKGE